MKNSSNPLLTLAEKHAAEQLAAIGFKKRVQDRREGHHKIPRLPPELPAPEHEYRHVLAIGDSHANPFVLNHRFEWLGRMIRSLQPEIVLDLGDSADMPSLHGVEKDGGRGARWEGYDALWKDFEAYYDAQDRLMREVGRMAKGPRLVKVRGNHEARISKALRKWELLRGYLSYDDLREEEYGWEAYPYGEEVEVEGGIYCHDFAGCMQVTAPRSVLMKELGRSGLKVYGHVHTHGVYVEGFAAAIAGGMFASPDDVTFKYARAKDRRKWTPGILELWTHPEHGLGSYAWTSFEDVQRYWG